MKTIVNVTVNIEYLPKEKDPWRVGSYVDGNPLTFKPVYYRSFRAVRDFYRAFVKEMGPDFEVKAWFTPETGRKFITQLADDADWAVVTLTYS